MDTDTPPHNSYNFQNLVSCPAISSTQDTSIIYYRFLNPNVCSSFDDLCQSTASLPSLSANLPRASPSRVAVFHTDPDESASVMSSGHHSTAADQICVSDRCLRRRNSVSTTIFLERRAPPAISYRAAISTACRVQPTRGLEFTGLDWRDLSLSSSPPSRLFIPDIRSLQW